jgi:hypothetical protein
MLSVLFACKAEEVEVNDYVRFVHEDETYEGAVLSNETDGDDSVVIALANEGDYGDRVEVTVPWDLDIPVLAQDYSDVEV